MTYNITSLRSGAGYYLARIAPVTDVAAVEEPAFTSTVAYGNDNYTQADYILWGDNEDITDKDKLQFIDACCIKSAVIGIAKNKAIVCEGNYKFCEEVREELSEAAAKADFEVKRIICDLNSDSAIIEATYRAGQDHKVYYFGQYEMPSTLRNETWSKLSSGDIVSMSSTSYGVSILLRGGEVLSWDEDGQVLTPSHGRPILFASELRSTSYAFSALLTTGKIEVWGDSRTYDYLPQDLKDARITITDMEVAGSCFVGYTVDGALRTWGAGENNYCHESGAHGATGFTSFLSVKEELQSDIEVVVGNDMSMVAVKKDGSVVAWGNEEYGGSLVPTEGQLGMWETNDIKWIEPTTIVATNNAYAAKRWDGRVVSWGGAYTGAVTLELAKGAKDLKASGDLFALITADDTLAVWPGDNQGVYSPVSLPDTTPLTAIPQKLYVDRDTGIVVILGHDCTYTPWSSWGECINGTQVRHREIDEPARNGQCTYEFEGSQTCEAVEKPDEIVAESSSITQKRFLIGAAGFAALGTFAVFGLTVCCCRRRRGRDDTL